MKIGKVGLENACHVKAWEGEEKRAWRIGIATGNTQVRLDTGFEICKVRWRPC